MANQIGLEPVQENPVTEDPITALANEEPHPSLFAGALDPEADEPEADASGATTSPQQEDQPATGDAAGGSGADAPERGGESPVDGSGAEPTEADASVEEPKPFVVLKHNGETYPVRDIEELTAMAQKGLDYTKKTQHLSAWMAAIQYIQQNPDFMECLQRGMSGQPVDWSRLRGAGSPPPDTNPNEREEIPPQGDEESYEDYTRRLAIHEGRRAAEAVMADRALEATKAEVLQQVHADPLGQAVMSRIFEASHVPASEGGVPRVVLDLANHNPEVFQFLYANARTLHVAQQAQSRTASPAAPSAPQQKPQPPKAPYLEPSRGGVSGKAKSLDNPELTAAAASNLDAMSWQEFEQLQKRVLSGERVLFKDLS